MRVGLVVLDGSTFFVSDRAGDVSGGQRGFFYADTRHLSRWELLVDGCPIEPSTARNVDYYSARIIGTAAGSCTSAGAPALTVQRDRIVADGVHEDVAVESHDAQRRTVTVELRFGADFADLFEVRRDEVPRRTARTDVTGRSVTLAYERDGFRRGTCLRFTTDGELSDRSARFVIHLEPHERWSVCVDISCVEGAEEHGPRTGHGGFGELHPQMPESLDEWMADAPEIDTDSDAVAHTYRQTLLDLAALRFVPHVHVDASVPAGGLPWYMAMLGRDSLITSYMALPFRPQLAAATLQALAAEQATEDDAFRDAEPGKIMHELRRGELVHSGTEPHSPYYGSHDATPLFLIVLDEYERWTGDRELVVRLESAARAALAWIDGPGDRDGDGFLEYATRSSAGMANQCWKDSDSSMVFADGRRATPPIAACEIQGYAFDARRRAARLAREVWNDPALADRLDRDADRLAERFAEHFWCDARQHPALALDGERRRVDALTSNIGHLLWSGILTPEHARHVARHLLSDELFSGWGIRTLSSGDAPFNPVEYHNGTVWPHDTAIAAEGLRRYGFDREAGIVARSLFDAAGCFDHRLPELFAGFPRDDTTVAVAYADASCPQAWAAASALLAIRTLLGLDVADGRLRVSPTFSPGDLTLGIRGLAVRGGRVDVPATQRR